MRAVGIICEYNPFHDGHARQLRLAREMTGADAVVALMSEQATERGTLAVADPYVRAEIAVRNGADLVIGLPYPYSASPAEFFADAGVRILAAVGVSYLHFGSESGDLDALSRAADVLYSPAFTNAMTDYQNAHPDRGVMRAREDSYRALTGAPLPGGSNDHLAMAYLHALQKCDREILPMTVRREGQAYLDASRPTDRVSPSATALRALWERDGLEALRGVLPPACFSLLCAEEQAGLAPRNHPAFDALLLSYYRLSDESGLAAYLGLSGGVAGRLCRAAASCSTVEQLLSAAGTRAYTESRLRRALLAGFCRVTESDVRRPPAYARVLAANDTGRAYLSRIRKTCTLPLLTKPSRFPDGEAALRQRAIEVRLENLVAAATGNRQTPADLLRRSPRMITRTE